MSNTRIVELDATGIRFFSEYDEAAYFEWLKKFVCIQKVEGRGQTLSITVDTEAVNEDALREFLALFLRYEIDMRQLRAFDCDEFADWFRDKRAYWYTQVFGEPD
jgi:hypothetical protein